MHRISSLIDLLADIFSYDELQRFLLRFEFGAKLLRDIPQNISTNHAARLIVEGMERRGVVSLHFFDSLEREHPGRQSDIRTVKSQWFGATGASTDNIFTIKRSTS